MADTGLNTAANVTNTSWSAISASSIETSNDTRASATSTSYLVAEAYNFSFGIPADATIDGIEVQAEFSASLSGVIASLRLSISGNGGAAYSATKEDTVTGTTDTTRTFGGPTDLWGEASFSEYGTQDGNFFIKIEGKTNTVSRTCRLDYLAVKIYYTEANGSGFFLLMGA